MKDYNKAKTANARIDIRVPADVKEEIKLDTTLQISEEEVENCLFA